MDSALYFLPQRTADLAGSRWNVYLIGAGGTGSWVLRNLARLFVSPQLATERIASLTVIDADIVEARNVGRQDFHRQEVGLNKAEALATRYNLHWGTSIRYAARRVRSADFGQDQLIPAGSLREPTLVIGAVDRGASRRAMHDAVLQEANRGERRAIYWLDCGNGEFRGQIVWGNCHSSDQIAALDSEIGCEFVPYPSLVFPELLANDPLPEPGCAEMAPDPQSLYINSAMGLLAAQMVVQLLEGRLQTHFVSLDLQSLQLTRQALTRGWLMHMADHVQTLRWLAT